ncbi:MAG: FtsW/RodA/SpoVE family cell cycle protein, partial [Chloroflexota bacterium]|nr:FtsW/RodA/SpoVE family cell cycle protein [Chloroflexota bacterium]
LVWAAIGLVGLAAMARIDYHHWQRFSVLIIAVALLLLIAVLFVGKSEFGSYSWVWGGSGQPSEFCKLAIIIYMANWLSSKGEQIRKVSYGLLPFAVLVGVVVGLIVIQPDFGAAFIIVAVAVSMFFIAGAELWQLGLGIAVGGMTFALLIIKVPYALERIIKFAQAWSDPYGKSGYHVQQALTALIAGGPFGCRPGESRQKFFLYAPHTDSIFAVLGEDLGLIGCLTVVGLFAALAYRGFKIAREAPDTFGTILAAGLTFCLVFQAFLDIGVITATVPFTGITLPFVSYGGSSLIVSLASIGLLLNISKELPKKGSKKSASYDLGRRYWRPRVSRTRRR